MTAKTKLLPLALLALALAVLPAFSQQPVARHRFEIGDSAFLLDGKPFQIRCGEMHAARVPREYWDHRLAMMRAMGLNTVCAYLFWNMHEPRPGEFNWSGQADAAEFCRLAQKHGLWVILRPGPYACAEWEMGGLPWWLLRDPDMRLRTTYPGYMDAAHRYLKEVGRVLGPLQITRGGPILMVQVENEYGFFGNDAGYMKAMRQAVLDAGFDVPLFACNPPSGLRNGFVPGLFQVVNFGSDPKGGFAALRAVQPKGPLMCGEFYPGWFDTWGAPHHLGNTPKYLADLKYMLETGASFSIYMAHGGSTFGLWSGCDRPFKPDTSSYDYDAPINEAGAATEKFFLTRDLMRAHLNPGETIPAGPPAPNPVQTFAPVSVAQVAPLFKNLPSAAQPAGAPLATPSDEAAISRKQGVSRDARDTSDARDAGVASDAPTGTVFAAPLNFESPELNLPHGAALYRVTLPAGPAATLNARAIADFGFVFLDGKRTGALDRRFAGHAVDIPARDKPATLDILVEAIGRINFGNEMHDRKGLGGPVTLKPKTGGGNGGKSIELTGWQIFPLPLDDAQLAALRYQPVSDAEGRAKPPAEPQHANGSPGGFALPSPTERQIPIVSSEATGSTNRESKIENSPAPAFWRATVTLGADGDTWLDMRDWGKGVVWVNGHCLGRFWNIGPTQTMYVPGPWLRRGENEIIIFDLLGPAPAGANAAPQIAGLPAPILDQLRPSLDFSRGLRRQSAPALDGAKPAWTGAFPQGAAPVEIHFNKPVRGRFFAIESLDAHDGKPYAAIAELELLDANGARLPIDGWTVACADSEEHTAADGAADNALDGQTASFWHTAWSDSSAPAPAHPHRLIIDLGKKREISGFRYIPRQGPDTVTGRIKDARVYVGDNLVRSVKSD